MVDRVLLVSFYLYLAYACLSPFEFGQMRDAAIILEARPFWWDIVQNILLFAPLGLLWRLNGAGVALTTIFCMLSSLGFEIAQLALPTRHPAIYDILANTIGSLLGAQMNFAEKKFPRHPLVLAMVAWLVVTLWPLLPTLNSSLWQPAEAMDFSHIDGLIGFTELTLLIMLWRQIKWPQSAFVSIPLILFAGYYVIPGTGLSLAYLGGAVTALFMLFLPLERVRYIALAVCFMPIALSQSLPGMLLWVALIVEAALSQRKLTS